MHSTQMQMILACTHASLNKCMYVHCMMIKQNHNKLNKKKYNFIVVFARTPQLCPRRSVKNLCKNNFSVFKISSCVFKCAVLGFNIEYKFT